jgi:hypothetical protein
LEKSILRDYRHGDWVTVTIKREDYYGLEGRVVDNAYPYSPLSVRPSGLIRYFAVELEGNFFPKRLAQMPIFHGNVYFFTESQIEWLNPDNSAISVLGEEYFA